MLLKRLKEFADTRIKMPPVLYTETPVRYIIELDGNGSLLTPRPTDTADPANPKTKRGQRRLVPQIQRTVGVKPLLLADKADYTLGLGNENAKLDRVAACNTAYMDMVTRCAEQTNAPEVLAVLRFLHNTPAEQLDIPKDFDYGALITFRVGETFVADLPAVRAFWAAQNAPDGESSIVMQCIVCGEQRPVLPRLQGKIKGVPGGQTSGTSIISANAVAFESYGLEASLIAPTCADCGERFTKALNYLLADPSSRMFLAGSAFIYWTREDVGFDLMALFDKPDPAFVPRGGESAIDIAEIRAWLAGQLESRAKTTDANDTIYHFRASEDYDPSSHLGEITAPLLAINSADDFVNPPELPMMEAMIGKVRRGKFVLIPASDETRGHGTHSRPTVFGPYLAEFLKGLEKN